MKNLLLIFLCSLFAISISFGQSTQDTIAIKKAWGGLFLLQNGKQLSLGKATKIMEGNPIAYKEMKAAKSSNLLSTVISMAGGFMIGLPLGSAIAGKKPNWTLAGIGAGLVVATIPINNKVKKRVRNAVAIYNDDLKRKK